MEVQSRYIRLLFTDFRKSVINWLRSWAYWSWTPPFVTVPCMVFHKAVWSGHTCSPCWHMTVLPQSYTAQTTSSSLEMTTLVWLSDSEESAYIEEVRGDNRHDCWGSATETKRKVSESEHGRWPHTGTTLKQFSSVFTFCEGEKANLHPAILTTFYLRTAEHILCSYVSVSCGNCNKTEPKSLQHFVMTAEKITHSRCVCMIDLHSFCMHLASCTLQSKYSSMLKRYIQIHRNNFPGFPSLDD